MPDRIVIPALLGLLLVGCNSPTGNAPTTSPQRPPDPTLSLSIRGTDLVIERPADWWPGGLSGGSTLHSYIGAGHGFPNFAVDWDPAPLAAGRRDATSTDRIETLFEVLTREHHVEFAEWVKIHGLDVYSTASTYASVAGPIRVRRLLLAYDDRPYLLSWSAPVGEFPAIEELVEWCAHSLHLRPPEPVAAR